MGSVGQSTQSGVVYVFLCYFLMFYVLFGVVVVDTSPWCGVVCLSRAITLVPPCGGT